MYEFDVFKVINLKPKILKVNEIKSYLKAKILKVNQIMVAFKYSKNTNKCIMLDIKF